MLFFSISSQIYIVARTATSQFFGVLVDDLPSGQIISRRKLLFPKNEFIWKSRDFVKAAAAQKGKFQNKGTEILVMNYEK